MYKIGEFSKIVSIPVRTLRYYDEIGILIPSEVDQFTGYRYYTEENIMECELIQLLKSIDFTLEEIRRYKENLTIEVLDKKEEEIRQQIEDLNQKYKRLYYIRERLIKEENKNQTTKILRRDENEKRSNTKIIKR